MSKNSVLLSTAYLAPVQYYSKLLHYDHVVMEKWENYQKQTYRNRCKIYGANGVMNLIIPVTSNSQFKVLIKDMEIDYSTHWQKLHWKSIESAYRSTPYFSYFADDLNCYYKKNYKFLLDFNLEVQQTILDILEIDKKINFTTEFLEKEENNCRDLIHPKKQVSDIHFLDIPYHQVFSEKYGFQSNLSILDLLFNEGMNAVTILQQSFKNDQ